MLVLSIPLSRASTNPQTNKARRIYAKRKYSSFINRKGKTGHSLAKTHSCTGKIPKQEKLSQLVKVSIYMYVLMRCCETHTLPPRAHIFGALASEGTCVCVNGSHRCCSLGWKNCFPFVIVLYQHRKLWLWLGGRAWSLGTV